MAERTIRPNFDKGRTQSVSLPPENRKTAKTYRPDDETQSPQTQVMQDLPPSIYLVTGSSSKDFPVDPSQFLLSVGKSSKCDIIIEDNQLSPVHMIMVKVQENCLLMDRGKRDALKFDGVATRQCCKDLDSRVVIKLGKHWLVYDARAISPLDGDSDDETSSNVLSQNVLPGKIKFSLHNKSFETDNEPCLIGAHPSCDIKLHSDSVADFAAIMYWEKNGIFIEKMGPSRAAVSVNSKRIAQNPVPLNDGDVITVGKEEITVDFEGDIATRSEAIFNQIDARPDLALTVVSGADSHTFNLTQNCQYIIGRASKADIVLNNPSVSREHAKIMVRDKILSITDNGSFNKVKVNAEEVEKATLFAGDIVEMGDCALLVHYDAVKF